MQSAVINARWPARDASIVDHRIEKRLEESCSNKQRCAAQHLGRDDSTQMRRGHESLMTVV
jgi:hypothetical protein